MQKRPETLGEIIKTARDKSGLTVEELTARVEISERYLYRIENEGKVPKFEVLKKLVRMLYNCDDRSMKIVKATAKAALESQEAK